MDVNGMYSVGSWLGEGEKTYGGRMMERAGFCDIPPYPDPVATSCDLIIGVVWKEEEDEE